MRAAGILGDDERATLLAWGCWAVPLLITEVIIQSGALFKTRD